MELMCCPISIHPSVYLKIISEHKLKIGHHRRKISTPLNYIICKKKDAHKNYLFSQRIKKHLDTGQMVKVNYIVYV